MDTTTQLLTLRDAAEILAVSQRTVWRLVRAGELHPYRVGHQLRLDPDDLRDYLDRHRERTAA